MGDTEQAVQITITLEELAASYGLDLGILKEKTRHLKPWVVATIAPRYRIYDLEPVLNRPIERIEVYTVQLAAVVLGLVPQRVNALLKQGKIMDGIRTSSRIFIPRTSLDAELVRRIRGRELGRPSHRPRKLF